MTSRIISSVPVAIRMISGRKRMYSMAEGAKLTGMRHLCGGTRLAGAAVHLKLHIHLGLIQNPGGSLAYGGQERLRIHAHPDHHCDERNGCGPFAPAEVRHVMAH